MSAATTDEVRSDTELVAAAREREDGAYGELFRRWYDRCYDVAFHILRDREAAADVAQDAFLVGWERLAELREPGAFGGWILRITRNRSLNRLTRERSRSFEPIDSSLDPTPVDHDPGNDPAVLAERQAQRRLVWTAVAVLGERDSSLLDLHLRHGLEPSEIAEELQITANNASQLLFRMRRKLRDAVGAVLLWRDGRPTCDELAELVEGTGPFDLHVASTIRQHQRTCPTCRQELSRQTDPVRMFASVPLVVAPVLFRDRAVAALTQAGVPVTAPVPVSGAVATGTSGASAKLVTIGAAAIGVGLLVTVGLWPMGPGRGGSAEGAAGAPPSLKSTVADTTPPATPTAAPTPTGSPEDTADEVEKDPGRSSTTTSPDSDRTAPAPPPPSSPPSSPGSPPPPSTPSSPGPTSPSVPSGPCVPAPPHRRHCHWEMHHGVPVWVCHRCPHVHPTCPEDVSALVFGVVWVR
ncbi:MAG: sigma-70 family RNA polymerase sigma factor [Kineosporiaceae bacterium]